MVRNVYRLPHVSRYMRRISGILVNSKRVNNFPPESLRGLNARQGRGLKALRAIAKPCLLFTVYLKVLRAGRIGVNTLQVLIYRNRTRPAQSRLAGMVYRGVAYGQISREAHVHAPGPASARNLLWKVAGSQRFCAFVESCWGIVEAYTSGMGSARDPFLYDRDQSHDEDSEFGFGRGHFADPRIDYSDDGEKSLIPIADPDATDQLLTLAMIRRMDINDPNAQPDPYVLGNTDRYGAQPPLVRERKRPRYKKPVQPKPPKMQRQW